MAGFVPYRLTRRTLCCCVPSRRTRPRDSAWARPARTSPRPSCACGILWTSLPVWRRVARLLHRRSQLEFNYKASIVVLKKEYTASPVFVGYVCVSSFNKERRNNEETYTASPIVARYEVRGYFFLFFLVFLKESFI